MAAYRDVRLPSNSGGTQFAPDAQGNSSRRRQRGLKMAKSAEAFRTISEVADDLDIPKHVLRFWEVKFTQIRPMKRGGGRRYYRPEDVELLKGIQHLLHREGYTIKGVQKILREQGVDAVKTTAAGAQASEAVPALSGEAGPNPGQSGRVRLMSAKLRPGKVPARSATNAAGTKDQAVAAAIFELEACRALLRDEPVATVVPVRARAGRSR